jgi:hypothetical protein
MNQFIRVIPILLVVAWVDPLFAQTRKQIQPLEDKSLSVAEYEKLGMPSIEKKWQLNDYKKAVDVLTQLKSTPERLPRFQSKTSGPVFAKFLDIRGIEEFIAQSSHETIDQMVISMEVVQCLKGFGMIYARAAWPKHSLTAEQIELQEPVMILLVKAQASSKKYFEALDQSDAEYPAKKQSYASMQRGFGIIVTGMIIMLTDRAFVTPESRIRQAEIMHKYVPDVLNLLTDDQRADYRNRLHKLAGSEQDTHVKKLLDQIVLKVKP